ncbi:alpha,alpha-phosphotrehalase [[Mycoplasma] mobile]|uniref:Alpha, alpha phosphotrehalase n=1 Tax=Mycoplasma mobile (strain ATCC 43663 / 163K / NCTC 11711) TaxID=267748 RepID=Q6KIM7_MYCM1|nr:alpha,alpha-phosphotrehalase [[Mycoplasma] mobile]AAT27549.1 alpha, alpha phosphotrehalase [Mycoplasma mobile 163K]
MKNVNSKKIVYQIYPSSFKDSKGTGRGDIKGIIEKLDYIKDLGVDYLWLSPIFKSPLKDNGYDVSDYLSINTLFGDLEDLKSLIKKAKEKNLKVMLDMVFNHTSTEHEWFKKWINNDPEYKDFYISKKSVGKPPTNWVSKFGGSAWKEYKKNNWYLHLFDETQADLNWENEKVKEKIKEVIRFYINLGVKGFRFDVINLISKSNFNEDETDGRKFYTDGKKVEDYLQELRNEFPKEGDFLTVGELSSTTMQKASIYSNLDKKRLDSAFTFHHLKIDYDEKGKFIYKKPDIKKLNEIFDTSFTETQKLNGYLAVFLNNHDQPRAVSRFIDEEFHNVGAKMLGMLTLSLPGDTYIYQGEEIGMKNPNFENKEDYKDVETLNYFKELKLEKANDGIKQKSRDNSRTPMQWNSEKNSGFSMVKPWINVAPSYKEINVEKQENDPNSILSFYRKMVKVSKSDKVFANGNITFLPYKENLIQFTRTYKNKTYYFIFSFSNKKISLDSKSNIIILYSNYEYEKNIIKPYQFIVGEISE